MTRSVDAKPNHVTIVGLNRTDFFSPYLNNNANLMVGEFLVLAATCGQRRVFLGRTLLIVVSRIHLKQHFGLGLVRLLWWVVDNGAIGWPEFGWSLMLWI